ncbi:hypothetical protein V6N13_086767 [Hibiscus sabdariffa]|uniref:Uncharacterized protein n=1 Tax=Hibiscus sabdariffa TaxID=183260 RepID=A0ABR2FU63_9ROSI
MGSEESEKARKPNLSIHKVNVFIKSESYPFPRILKQIMGCSRFFKLLLLSMLLNLILSVSQGMGRNMVQSVEVEESSAQLEFADTYIKGDD